MEVVLLEDVKALGKKGQIVKVNDGYARNFILPKKLGIEATSKNLNDLKLQKANADKIASGGKGSGCGSGGEIHHTFHQSGRGRKSVWLCFIEGNYKSDPGSAWNGN